MAKQNYDDSEGRWVTIANRRVFIKNKQTLSDAMIESGIFHSQENKQIKDVKKQFIKDHKFERKDITYEKGYKKRKHKDEMACAEFIREQFGGEILCINEDLEEGLSADYLWEGKLWELKTPKENTQNAINKLFNKGLNQIKKNRGGLIFDLTKNDDFTVDQISKWMCEKIKKCNTEKVTVMFIKKSQVLEILEIKK